MSQETTKIEEGGMIDYKQLFEKKTINCQTHGERLVSVFKGKEAKCDLCLKESEEQERKNQIERQKEIDQENFKRFIELRFLQSLIPPRFKEHSFETYIAKTEQQIKNKQAMQDYAVNFEDNFKKGNSVILCGNVGTGKTHLSCAVGNYIIKNLNKTALFLNAIDAFSKIKATYSKKSEISEIETLNQFLEIDLLILDEFGVQIGSETEKLILFRIINKRYEYLKPTILITNLSVVEIKKFEERIFDRLKENGILLNFTGESNRKSKKL